MAQVNPNPDPEVAAKDAKAEAAFFDVVDKVKDTNVYPYAEQVYWCVSLHNPLRKYCIHILDWPWFDRIIMLLILVSSTLMASFQEPIMAHMQAELKKGLNESWGCGPGGTPGNDLYDLNKWYENRQQTVEAGLEKFFLACFTLEMVIKLIAQGLIYERGSYLRSGWNWLDAIVVISGFILMFSNGSGAVQVLRLFRLLRPLRALQRVRGMRVLVQCILGAIPQMCRVFLVLVLLVLVLAIIGVQLFQGKLRYACWVVDGPGNDPNSQPVEETGYTCDPHCILGDQWDAQTQQIVKACDSLGPSTKMERNGPWGMNSWTCAGPNQQCLCASSGANDPYCTWLDNPNYGINSFDNILSAMMTIFQSITLEGWVDVMYALQDGFQPVWVPPIYQVMIVLLGALIVMNLFLAVLADNFAMADNEDKDKADEILLVVTLSSKKDKQEVEKAAAGVVGVKTAKADVKKGLLAVEGDSVDTSDLVQTLEAAGFPATVQEEEEQTLEDAASEIKHTNPFRRKCHELASNPKFDIFIVSCIIANTLIMCVDYYPPHPDVFDGADDSTGYKSSAFYWSLFSLNLVLTIIFTFETCLKLIGYGFRIFAKDSFNIFDAIVVAISLVEVLLEVLEKTGSVNLEAFPGGMSALRALRVFRILKMVRSVKSLQTILSALVRSLYSVFYLAMLLLLFIFIFALLGMEFFGGFVPYPLNSTKRVGHSFTKDIFPCSFQEWDITWEAGDGYPRCNFDRFGDAFLSIFIVLSGENWNEIYFDQHRAAWHANFPTATIYFICLFVVGNLLLFNLFIAILISNMEGDDDEEEEEEGEKKATDENAPMYSYEFGTYSLAGSAELSTRGTMMDRASSNLSRASTTGINPADVEERKPTPQEKLAETDGSVDKSLMLFSWSNPVRRFCALTVWHPHFDSVILVLIVVSSVLLLFDWPGYSNQHLSKKILSVCNLIFTILFTIEMCLKIIVYGFIKSKDKEKRPAYLRVGWNVLDFIVVLISIFSLISTGVPALKAIPASALRAVRALRALRPLRLISRLEEMRIVVNTLLGAVPAVGVFAMIMFLFVLIFAILFVNMFGGRLGYCLDPLFGDEDSMSRVVPGLREINGTKQNDYEECMALDKYYLNRYNTLGVPIHDPIFSCKHITEPGGCAPLDHPMFRGEMYELKTDYGEDYVVGDANPYYHGKKGYHLYGIFPQWVNPDFGHFDNVFAAIHLLIEVACLEGWPDVMYWVMDTDLMTHYIIPYWISTDEDPAFTRGTGTRAPFPGPIDGVYRETDIPKDGCVAGCDQGVDVCCFGNRHVTNQYVGAAFFVIWVVLGCFVLLNMVIGVVLDSFNAIKEENDGLTMMTEEQGEWVKAQKAIIAMRPLKQPKPPAQSWRMPFFNVVNSNLFEIIILAIIILNMFFMCITTWDPSPTNTDIEALYLVSFYSNLIFFVLYTLEMLIKWVGLGLKQYFSDAWNVFDFFLVITSAVDIAISTSGGEFPFPPAVLRVVRMFRVVRILRILKTAKNLRTIITTIRISIPALTNIACLLGIILSIYAIICMNFFFMVNYTPGDIGPRGGGPYNTTKASLMGKLIWSAPWNKQPWHVGDDTIPTAYYLEAGNEYAANLSRPFDIDGEVPTGPWYYGGYSNEGDFVNRHANFRFIMGSIITLFRCATGESFNGMMHDLMAPDWGSNMLRCCPTCGPQINLDEKVPGSCGPIENVFPGGVAAIIFWSYTLLMGFIILNGLFIGVIVDNFTNIGSENKSITVEAIEEFREVWLRFDPKGTFAIPSHSLLVILQQLREPLGVLRRDADGRWEKTQTRGEMLQLLARLDIPDHDGQIHFLEVLTALAHNNCGTALPVCTTTKQLQKSVAKRPGLKHLRKPVANALTSYLITSMQTRYRGYAGETAAPGGYSSGADSPVQNLPVTSSTKIKPNQVAPVS